MAEPKETMIDCRGCRLLLRRAGRGEPLLFLHGAMGFPGWLPFFQQLVGPLSKCWRRTIRVSAVRPCPNGSTRSATLPISISISSMR